MRGTGGEYVWINDEWVWDQDPSKVGIATSADGINWTYLAENPIFDESGPGPAGDYAPEFIGYLGENGSGDDEYLLVWNEAGSIQYGTTTDFVNVVRDSRGAASWPSKGGADSVWRQGDMLYIFTGRDIHTMDLSGVIPEPATLAVLGLGGIAALLRRRRQCS